MMRTEFPERTFLDCWASTYARCRNGGDPSTARIQSTSWRTPRDRDDRPLSLRPGRRASRSRGVSAAERRGTASLAVVCATARQARSAQGIEISERSVSRILHDADLQPHRQQMYLTSHDEEFREKRDDVLRINYETPKNEHIVCVDEKTGIQALQRRHADIAMSPVRRELEYKRHGTLCWMGALDVRRGKPFGFVLVSLTHDSDTFIELLVIDAVYPPGRGHIIMDNLSAHDTPGVNECFDEHPRWTRHFTPKHASWLNQIECWFSILSRHVSLAARSRRPMTSPRRSTRTSPGIPRLPGPSAGRIAPKSWGESGGTSAGRH